MQTAPPSAVRKIWLAIAIAWRRLCDAFLPRDYQKKHQKNFAYSEIRSRRAAKVAAFLLFVGGAFLSGLLALSLEPLWRLLPIFLRDGGWHNAIAVSFELFREIIVWQVIASCVALFLFLLAKGVWEHRFWAFRVGFWLLTALCAFSLLIFIANEDKSAWIWAILLYNLLTLHSLWQVERTTESWH